MAAPRKWIFRVGGLFTLFCVSFIFFDSALRGNEVAKKPKQPPIPASLIGKSLPVSHLVDLSGMELDRRQLLYGKVVLVLVSPECQPCLEEGEFIQTIIKQRRDVRFIGVAPFGESKEVLKLAENKFPFKVYFDEGFLLGREFSVNKVPIKIYVEDGIVKKSWSGSTIYNHTEDEFKQWLKSLP